MKGDKEMEANWIETSASVWDFYISGIEWGVVFRRREKFYFFTRFPSKPRTFESLFEAQSFVEELVFRRLEEMIEAVKKVRNNKRGRNAISEDNLSHNEDGI